MAKSTSTKSTSKSAAKKSATPRRVHRDGQAPVTVTPEAEASTTVVELEEAAAHEAGLGAAFEADLAAEPGDIVVGVGDAEPEAVQPEDGDAAPSNALEATDQPSDEEPAPTSTEQGAAAPLAQAGNRKRKPIRELPAGEQRRVLLWMLSSTIRMIDETDWDTFEISGMSAARATIERARQKVDAAKTSRSARRRTLLMGAGTVRVKAANRAEFKDVLDEADLDGIKVLSVARRSARCQLKSGGKAVLPAKILEAEVAS